MSEQIAKPEIEEVSWTTQQTFVGIFFTIVPWIAFTFLTTLLNTGSAPKPVTLTQQADIVNAIVVFIFSTLIECAFLLAPFYFARHTKGLASPPAQSVFQLLGMRGFKCWSVLGLIILMFVGVYAINIAYAYAITVFHLPLQTNSQGIFDQGKRAPITIYATLLVAVLVAPLCEELFFRSFVLMGFLREMSVGWAIVLSSLIFAVTHGDPGSFVVLFVIGLALAFLRWRTRSVWPGVILHMLNNGFSALEILLALHH